MTLTDAIDTQLARLRVRYAKTPLPKFFAWWFGELVGLLPQRWRDLVVERPEELLIETRPQELGVWRQSNSGCADFGSVARDLPVEEQQSEFSRLRSLVDDPQLRVYYCVPAERCLRREFNMPAAAEDKLRQVLAFEMDRQTPFKADQVYFDYRVVGRDVAAKNLKVQLTVVPRAQLDSELSVLGASGVGLDGVDCWRSGPGSARAGLNLLPPERRVKRKNVRLRVNLALAAVAVILLFLSMLQSLSNREQSIEAMTAEVQKAQNDAKQTSELAKRLEERTASANYLLQEKRDTTTMTELLADLTRRLPDDTFLERLTVDERGKVDVQGQSTNAAKLIDGLQKSDVLVNPGFTGTIQTDPRTHKERFNMSFELRRSREAAARREAAKPAKVESTWGTTMRLMPESARNQRFLAVVLALIALLLAYLLFVHWWFVAPHLAMIEQRRDLAEQQHHFAELIRRRPAIEERLKDVDAFEHDNQAFLVDGDATSAFSDLSERLKQAKERNTDANSRCQIQGVSPAPSREKEVYQRVSAAVVMSCEAENLVKILYDLETSNPYLFVDRMVIYRQQPVFLPGAKSATPATLVGAQFTLSGYLRQAGGKGKT